MGSPRIRSLAATVTVGAFQQGEEDGMNNATPRTAKFEGDAKISYQSGYAEGQKVYKANVKEAKKQMIPEKYPSWYSNRLVWSPELHEQAYEYTCLMCHKVVLQASKDGHNPPAACPNCGKKENQ